MAVPSSAETHRGSMEALGAISGSVGGRLPRPAAAASASPRPVAAATPATQLVATSPTLAFNGEVGESLSSPRAPGVVTPRPAPGALQWAEQMRIEVRTMPKKGTPVSVLCPEMRGVLHSNHLLLDDYSREKTVQWAAGIYRGSLNLHTKIDTNNTTLGLVLTDDVVETVLPGGPAFLAGLRKGDCIVTVRARRAASAGAVRLLSNALRWVR
jgi:hypothetical protein